MEAKTYIHQTFPPKTKVFISERIRNIHPEAPLAGHETVACEGVYYPLLEIHNKRGHKTLVPCVYKDTYYYIEEEYVTAIL